PAPAAATASVAAAAGPRAGLRVLLADDNVDAADTMSAMLEMSGHEVRTVYSGRAVLQEAPAFAPEVMLLDIGMPGMSGYEVAQRLRADAHYERTVLVALTGWGSESDRAQALDAGFDHHLTKPVDHLVLERLLRQLAPGSSELPAA
ncbi:MAG: putative histidine kinase, hybrid, partial [Ramlibacter sp.]|nr:putative histidine kinase, hybrid [Ramlibacter sp.]